MRAAADASCAFGILQLSNAGRHDARVSRERRLDRRKECADQQALNRCAQCPTTMACRWSSGRPVA